MLIQSSHGAHSVHTMLIQFTSRLAKAQLCYQSVNLIYTVQLSHVCSVQGPQRSTDALNSTTHDNTHSTRLPAHYTLFVSRLACLSKFVCMDDMFLLRVSRWAQIWRICSFYEFAHECKFIWYCINQNTTLNQKSIPDREKSTTDKSATNSTRQHKVITSHHKSSLKN